METRIKSFIDVRNIGHTASTQDTKNIIGRLAEERGNIIKHVGDFMNEGGVEEPVSAILEVFGYNLQMSEYLDRLADSYDREGSEKSREAAGEIRDEYLPTYGILNDQFYSLRILLSFLVKIGEAEVHSRSLEREVSTILAGEGNPASEDTSSDGSSAELDRVIMENKTFKMEIETLQQRLIDKERTISVLMKQEFQTAETENARVMDGNNPQ